MSEEWEQLLEDLKKVPRGTESAPQYLRHLMKMFVADFDTSMMKRLDVKFWNKLKIMMDEMQKASGNDRIVDLNVQSLAIGFITDLSLIVNYHYEIPNFGEKIPPELKWNPILSTNKKQVKSKKNGRVFLAFILLRMGDLMRYKENYLKSREFYEQSSRINPADGAVWNQLGLISALSAKSLESAYFHARALHSTIEFSTASSSLAIMFKKFANRDTSKSMPINELFLSCLAKIHFLLKIENFEEHAQKISAKMATSKEMLIPLMSVFEHLEGGTELEQQSIQYIKMIWTDSCKILLKTIIDRLNKPAENQEDLSNHLHLLSFFYRAPQLIDKDFEISTDVKKVAELLICSTDSSHFSNDIIKDYDGFQYFKCLGEHQYPLKRSHLAQMIGGNLTEISESEEDEEETSIDDSSNYDTSSKNTSPSKSPKKVQRNYSESSDEEILQRGRRRGRQTQMDESVDTDDDDEDF
uniref:EST1_DNA_bind domain-containing protein n=1 Tax=Caenorhabditis tropicalis TaxID=1561998 RepID=A0A1I7UNP1_9PELO